VPLSKNGPLNDFRFRLEQPAHQAEQIIVRLDGSDIVVSTRVNRSLDEENKSFFERDWPDWLTGQIYDLNKEAPATC
jgi:succinate dehydrogenase / fumarate reductase flavoprotein subunit